MALDKYQKKRLKELHDMFDGLVPVTVHLQVIDGRNEFVPILSLKDQGSYWELWEEYRYLGRLDDE